MYASAQYVNIISINQKLIVPFNFRPSWFPQILLIAYSKAELKCNCNEESLCSEQFLIENMSDKCLPTQTLLQVLFRHIFIRITGFMGMPNPVTILYKTPS